MPLSPQFQQLASLIQVDVERMRNRHLARIDRHDEVSVDDSHNTWTYRLRGMTLWQARGESLGKFSIELGLFTWWWHGGVRGVEGGSLDRILTEGERLGIPEFMSSCIQLEDAQDATMMSEIAAFLAQAHGVASRREGPQTGFYALFELTEGAPISVAGSRNLMANDAGRYSIAAPAPNLGTGRLNSRPVRSLPPPEHRDHPLATVSLPGAPKVPDIGVAGASVRRPSRDIFLPVAQLAMAAANQSPSNDYSQLLVTISVDTHDAKARFVVNVVALNGGGDLCAIDTTRDLFDAVGKMIADDVQSGNGRWRKLVARLRRSQRGATVDVEVQ